jgi:hypothetical protein
MEKSEQARCQSYKVYLIQWLGRIFSVQVASMAVFVHRRGAVCLFMVRGPPATCFGYRQRLKHQVVFHPGKDDLRRQGADKWWLQLLWLLGESVTPSLRHVRYFRAGQKTTKATGINRSLCLLHVQQ